MGFKTLMFLIVIIMMSLFFVQNLESISLVFLGFKSLSLPLSFWVILALFAGIFSSLIIQLLSNNPTPKTKSNQSFSSDNIPNNFPPSAPYNPPPVPPSFANKPKTEKKDFSKPSIYTKNTVLNNQFDESEGDFDFDAIPENINEDKQILQKKNLINSEINNIDVNPLSEQESIPSTEIKSEREFTPSLSEDIEDIPLETILKPREASIYSYQSREKTEIKPKLSTPQGNKQKQPSPNNPSKNDRGGIYDAPYRVIAPADDNNEEIDRDFNDDDEDWDF